MLGSLTSCLLWSQWREKRSRRMRNPQFYVSGKRPMGLPLLTSPLLVRSPSARAARICISRIRKVCHSDMELASFVLDCHIAWVLIFQSEPTALRRFVLNLMHLYFSILEDQHFCLIPCVTATPPGRTHPIVVHLSHIENGLCGSRVSFLCIYRGVPYGALNPSGALIPSHTKIAV